MALLIYGATGFTGTLASQHAARQHLPLILGGRNASKLEALSATLSATLSAPASTIPIRVFSPSSSPPSLIDASLHGVAVLLNCAGPFARTAAPLIAACIRTRVHYLDVAAELVSYHVAAQRDNEARRAGVMLMPGAGGSVAVLGCLAGRAVARFVASSSSSQSSPSSKAAAEQEEKEAGAQQHQHQQQKPTVSRIDIALRVAGPLSRGTLASAAEASIIATQSGAACLQRVDGELVPLDHPGNASTTMLFDFADGNGAVPCAPASLPDLLTLPRSTGVRDVRTYVYVVDGAFAEAEAGEGMRDGPTAEEREKHPCRAAVVVVGSDGGRMTERREVLRTLNGYDFTSIASVRAARLVLEGVVEGGWQTPAGLFGNEFAFEV